MSSWAEFTSGNFNVYGRWAALISGIRKLLSDILELMNVINNLGPKYSPHRAGTLHHHRITDFLAVFPFAIAGFGMAFVIVVLEIPFVTKWCPTGPRTQKIAEFFANPIFKTLLYAGFTAVMWLSILMASTSILAAAIGLSFTTLAYGVAIVRKDAPASPMKQPNVASLAVKAAVSNPAAGVKKTNAV
ncbi:hypothetical protein BC830DRAFT_1172612 [Chytriomyces sp. MP71]|nr:hypothetical protein BC830DRAFT_1172612 [Chytriomyces sp. MP71]